MTDAKLYKEMISSFDALYYTVLCTVQDFIYFIFIKLYTHLRINIISPDITRSAIN